MATIKQIDLQGLPEYAQQEVYDFYLFIKQRYQEKQRLSKVSETALLSEASLAEDWNKPEEDEAWQTLIDHGKKRPLTLDPSIDIRELIDQSHDVEF